MAALALEREAMTVFEEFLAVPEADRATWLDVRTQGRPELKTRVSALVLADRSTMVQTGGAIGALQEETIPERIGAYRIVSLIGRGGMGAVYLAERDAGDFTRTVAIKVIKAGLFSPEVVRRFQSERQTLATLAHPNIALLYDGGETEAGSPYIVMEYVDGAPLMQWVAEQTPTRAARLALFADICSAVAFAHARLIVHRDLSPSNVLVTRDGVAKLIDFGIAKPADEAQTQGDATAAQMTVTPGYTAPERLVSAQVTTAADVYSLGKLLNDLAEPHKRDRELNAIIARATADDPAERYPSVDALAAELDALRAGRPVLAYSGKGGYALRKFVRRHTRAVTASIGAFAALAAALALTVNANIQAEHARAEAEARFEQTRAIAKTMLFEAYDEVSVLPGATNARETLARTGLDYLEALAADPDAPQDVRLEAGLGFLRLSRVVGGGDVAELGRYADAKALIERAESIIAPLYAANSDDPQIRRAMGQLLVDQTADLLYADNDAAGARAKAIQAQEVMRPLSRADVEAARMYAVAMQGEADSYGWDDNYEAALPRHVAADDFIASLPPALRDDVQLMRARAANSRLMGEAHHRLGHVEEARAAIDRAVDLNRAVRDTDPNNPAYTRNLAISTWYRAVVHRTNERDELARQSIEESVSMARILRERDPNDAGALRMLAISNEVYAQILADQGRYAESYATGSEVIAIHHDLVQRADGAAGARRSLGAALMTHGGNSYNAGTYVRACAAWTEARDTFRALAAADQLSAFDRSNLLAVSEDYVARACNPPGPGLDDHS